MKKNTNTNKNFDTQEEKIMTEEKIFLDTADQQADDEELTVREAMQRASDYMDGFFDDYINLLDDIDAMLDVIEEYTDEYHRWVSDIRDDIDTIRDDVSDYYWWYVADDDGEERSGDYDDEDGAEFMYRLKWHYLNKCSFNTSGWFIYDVGDFIDTYLIHQVEDLYSSMTTDMADRAWSLSERIEEHDATELQARIDRIYTDLYSCSYRYEYDSIGQGVDWSYYGLESTSYTYADVLSVLTGRVDEMLDEIEEAIDALEEADDDD